MYDYRSYNNAFYGKFAPVFSNLFEVLYICVMCVAPAVAFATGGATLKYTDRTSVSAVYPDHRHFHLYRCHFRHRPGAPGSLRAFHLHHCRASDCIHSEYHPRMVCHPRNRTADDNIHTTIREGTFTPHSFTERSSWQTLRYLSSIPKYSKNRAMQSKAWGLAFSSTR